MAKARKARAKIDPQRITNIAKCLAIVGYDDLRVGLQCKRSPLPGKMCCKQHSFLEKQVGGTTRESIKAARQEMRERQKQQKKEAASRDNTIDDQTFRRAFRTVLDRYASTFEGLAKFDRGED